MGSKFFLPNYREGRLSDSEAKGIGGSMKNRILRLTAAEFLVVFLISLAAVEAYDCHPVFVFSIIISLGWFIIFGLANGVF